jgi:hypothetical protein
MKEQKTEQVRKDEQDALRKSQASQAVKLPAANKDMRFG